jgi:hypothetical protein
MPENIEQNRKLPGAYKFDRGGMPATSIALTGVVMNTVDPTRMGRVQVYIQEFGANDPTNQANWRTVQYLSPFYGITPGPNTQTADFFTTNRQSYGMWMTPPDVGTSVLCIFVNGDPSLGYYIGCIPEPGLIHMLPAIGAGSQGVEYTSEPSQLASATQLPVIEINDLDQAAIDSGTFYQQPRPIHPYVAGEMFQQGLQLDNQRGPITSNAQRESPSRVFGFSTPGRPAYQGGYTDSNLLNSLDQDPSASNLDVLARDGGASLVLDDGDLDGENRLVRLRSCKGHQIMMHDSGNFIHIIHANGQTWIELGQEGTVDVYSTNSVNVRTQGTINLHADQEINMYSGGAINMYAKTDINMQSVGDTNQLAQGSFNTTGEDVNVFSDTSLNMQSASGSWNVTNNLNLVAKQIGLNSGGAAQVTPVNPQMLNQFTDTKFSASAGWSIVINGLQSIVTRAPTHEPYPYHNLGVNQTTSLDE